MHSILKGLQNKLSNLRSWFNKPQSRGQSLVELALVLPVMILMLLGIVEISLFMGRYLDVLDLTREAARMASINDPAIPTATQLDCSKGEFTDFYFKAACIFSPPVVTGGVYQDSHFKGGFNRYINFDIHQDDVVISIYSVKGNGSTASVERVWPSETPGYWALSTNGFSQAHSNWNYSCDDNPAARTLDAAAKPQFTKASILPLLQNDFGAPAARAFVAVEAYYCYKWVLNIPVFTNLVPNPVRIHAYTLMPIPAAQPTRAPTSTTTGP